MIANKRMNLVVIGNGMVGHKLLQFLIDGEATEHYAITTFCEEPRVAYDRVHLSEFFAGKSADDLAMTTPAFYADSGITVLIGVKAAAIDRERQMVVGSDGREIPYDRLVLATGSFPFVPPLPGSKGEHRLVYRTIEDLQAMRASATGAQSGVVVGGGLLGLECANALRNMGLETHVVEFAPQLMGVQVDAEGGAILRGLVESLGVHVHTGKNTKEIVDGIDSRLIMQFADGSSLPTDLIVFSAGIRPRDELARTSGLIMGERGGVVIDDHCVTSDPAILAIGEVALWNGRIFGLVAPGNAMARVAADYLLGVEESVFTGADMSTKLKLMGVDVASFGDSHGRTIDSRSFRWSDEVSRVYKRIVVSADGSRLLGGILVGDAADYDGLHQAMLNQLPLPKQPETLILPAAAGAKPSLGGPDALPPSAIVCSCNNVSKQQVIDAVHTGAHDLAALKTCTKACTGCGGCSQLTTALLKIELKKLGAEVDDSLCPHFRFTRQQLYHLVRVEQIKTFPELLAKHGSGLGCEVCKPAIASILASCWNEPVLAPEHASLQDSNDYFLANIQKNGTYSVVPRVPGGEITADQLIAIGTVAKQFDLYCKVTGGQRIDLFGARVDQLPAIWRQLIAAGMESGHAYGKAFRTCKTCVGTTWCRYGQQDSVGLGVRLEQRYKGLRAPHKLKFAVSGCTRECAEAQSKDVGIIATEAGYNLYLCGNGGMKPRHADLFATDLDEAAVVRYIDRFLMFYIKTADRLERTATWMQRLEGGLEYLRSVIIDDNLGLAAELELQMQALVATYECEWANAIGDPDKLRRFRHFANDDRPDPDLVFTTERGQRIPAAVG